MITFFGFAGSGKTTFFQTLTKSKKENYDFSKLDVKMAKLPDERLEFLGEKFDSRKITFPELSFADIKGASKNEGFSSEKLAQLKNTKLIVYCLKGFGEDCNLSDDLESLELELILYDLELAEKRLSQTENSQTKILLQRCQEALTNGVPLRDCEFSESEKGILLNFPFLSIKKVIILINQERELSAAGESFPLLLFKRKGKEKIPVFSLYATMEKEISELSPPERKEYLKKLSLSEWPLAHFAKGILQSLSLKPFYTVGKDESKAWIISEGTPAVKAAGKIHTDMEKGFIRAEVLGFKDFKKAGSLLEAKHQNLVHSENKEYPVKDGDIIEFLFSK